MFDLSLLLNKHYLIMFEYFAAPSIKIPVLYVNHWRKQHAISSHPLSVYEYINHTYKASIAINQS